MVNQNLRDEFISKVRDGINSRTQDSPPTVGKILNDARKSPEFQLEFYDVKDYINSAHDDLFAGVSAYLNAVEANLKTVVMVIDDDNIEEDPQGDPSYVIIKSKPLKDRKVSDDPQYAICPNMTYSNQPSAHAIGSGFFIKENEIATAAHVVMGFRIIFENLRFVHGIQLSDAVYINNEIKIRVQKSSVFKPLANLTRPGTYFLSKMSSDWARIKVEHAYKDFTTNPITPVVIPNMEYYTNSFENKAIKGRKVYSIGHGLGLPMKVSYTGEVTWVAPTFPYFETNLTLLGGSSGSPVFDAETHELLGIFIRGNKKLELGPCGKDTQFLVLKNESSQNTGEEQECQRLDLLSL